MQFSFLYASHMWPLPYSKALDTMGKKPRIVLAGEYKESMFSFWFLKLYFEYTRK